MAEILVVNNRSIYLPNLVASLVDDGHKITEILPYEPGPEFENRFAEILPMVDCYVGSGGGGIGREAKDLFEGKPFYKSWHRAFGVAHELKKPGLAVCMTAQAAAQYYGSDIIPMPFDYRGYKTIYTDGFGINANTTTIRQVDSQQYRFKTFEKPMVIRGVSVHGIETFEAPYLLGTQWHPELGKGTIRIPQLMSMLEAM